jgi:hypothetical protein
MYHHGLHGFKDKTLLNVGVFHVSSCSSSLLIMTQIKELEMQIAQTRVKNGFDIDNPPWQKEETVGGKFSHVYK